MFDIGWTEILIFATISLFVIGPKDIPKFLAFIGRLMAKMRTITYEFRETVDDAIKDSELEEIKKEISLSDPEISKNLSDILNPKILQKQNDKLDNKNNNVNADGLKKEDAVNNSEKESTQQSRVENNNNIPSELKSLHKDKNTNDEVS